MAKKRKAKPGNKRTSILRIKWIAGSFVFVVLLLAYFIILYANVSPNAEIYYLHVPVQANIKILANDLKSRDVIKSKMSLRMMAYMKEHKIRPGLYKINKGWNNYQLLYHLTNDTLKPYLKINITSNRNRSAMVSSLATKSKVKRDSLFFLLNDSIFLMNLNGYNKESIYNIFIPGEYRTFKNLNGETLLRRIESEYRQFWTSERLDKCREMGYSPEEIVVLASIVYSETKVEEEMPVVAGLYLNRLGKNMRLESDPTVVYANKKFSLRRVFNKHKSVKSKYNTYKHKGLPPGPIVNPPPVAIEAVLNYTRHDYLYFCAKADRSGCHLFAPTYEEHKKNALRYQRALDSLNIK